MRDVALAVFYFPFLYHSDAAGAGCSLSTYLRQVSLFAHLFHCVLFLNFHLISIILLFFFLDFILLGFRTCLSGAHRGLKMFDMLHNLANEVRAGVLHHDVHRRHWLHQSSPFILHRRHLSLLPLQCFNIFFFDHLNGHPPLMGELSVYLSHLLQIEFVECILASLELSDHEEQLA